MLSMKKKKPTKKPQIYLWKINTPHIFTTISAFPHRNRLNDSPLAKHCTSLRSHFAYLARHSAKSRSYHHSSAEALSGINGNFVNWKAACIQV